VSRLALALAHALMWAPGPLYRRLPARVQAWAIHTHLMTVPFYRALVEAQGRRP
jgi:hypothetical protein